jgi:hypothetical protein
MVSFGPIRMEANQVDTPRSVARMNWKPEISWAGDDLLKRWLEANERLVAARRELNSAECAERNATNELGKFLVPEKSEDGEKFHVWIGNGLLQAQRLSLATYGVHWRKEPTKK